MQLVQGRIEKCNGKPFYFIFYFNLKHLPAETYTLQLNAQLLSRSFMSVHSIINNLNGVRTMHLLLGHTLDHLNGFLINLTLKGLTRLKQHCIKKAEPITMYSVNSKLK